MAEEKLNIYQRLAKIRKMTEVIRKNKSGYNYKYVTEDEILAKVTAGMEKYQVSLIPDITPGSFVVTPYQYTKDKMTKAGDKLTETIYELLCQADITFKWVCDDNPEDFIVVHWCLIGQQSDASQCFGSSLTYMNRYFMLKYFQIATPDDDPDNYRSKKAEAEQQDEAAVLVAITSQVDGVVHSILDNTPDKREEVAAFIKTFIKSGNYFKIKEAEKASELLAALQDKFLNESNSSDVTETPAETKPKPQSRKKTVSKETGGNE
ncbi:MAG: ERF family protein [Endomicrobiaceae bacterium]|nr:ERF family protein [Endomicrobiaceae bacterium]